MKETITYAKRIYTDKGIVKENIFSSDQSVLHIGSGSNVLPGAVTIDILDLPGVDIVHDLDTFPWPFADNHFDLIFAHSVFEHLEDQLAIMEETHRILKPHGRLVIAVPHFRCVDAFTDATHEHFFTRKSLDYYTEKPNALAGYQYTKLKYKEIGFWYGWPQESQNLLRRWFKNYIHKHPTFYDSHLSLIFPTKIIIWELEVIK